MGNKEKLREELDLWFIKIGVTDSGGEKETSALDVGVEMLEAGHSYDEAFSAAQRFYEVGGRNT
jgi:hypothetical protein